MIVFRPARRDDVPAIVAMLADDELGSTRELEDLTSYYAAFDAVLSEGGNRILVGVDDKDHPIATYQLTLISGLSLSAARRAQIESVRVAAPYRGQGVGAEVVADAERRARAAGCRLLQLTSNRTRERALDFYEQAGFTPSHFGFKKYLS
ncbi:aminoalkylphosphonic acid N-acetyltransferase [Roseovarius albus]|uniref:Aminoalkylphosphonic acid N-acetyltransferase n=1 Tax=Roseovarius albus TaxID=1247867 RepID=A0A1X7A3B6_9RHOB|nr:GNAT family N-acetyltransferase [Roseovarius albus]SLN68994.1 aminoalkylphosphonic acid N-acetyltransferase [Roseovarius albus]